MWRPSIPSKQLLISEHYEDRKWNFWLAPGQHCHQKFHKHYSWRVTPGKSHFKHHTKKKNALCWVLLLHVQVLQTDVIPSEYPKCWSSWTRYMWDPLPLQYQQQWRKLRRVHRFKKFTCVHWNAIHILKIYILKFYIYEYVFILRMHSLSSCINQDELDYMLLTNISQYLVL